MRGLFLVAAAVLPLAANAEQAPGASWFAANPEFRTRMLNACREYPGDAPRVAACANAAQGEGLAAEAEIRAHLGDLTKPSTLKYWRDRPVERQKHLQGCANIPAGMPRTWCDVAQQAEDEAKKQGQADPAPTKSARSARRT